MFGPEWEEVTGGWRRVYNEQLYDLYRSSHNTGVIKLWRMRLAGRVAYVGGSEICTGFWLGNLKERDSLGNLDIGGRMILK